MPLMRFDIKYKVMCIYFIEFCGKTPNFRIPHGQMEYKKEVIKRHGNISTNGEAPSKVNKQDLTHDLKLTNTT